MVQSLSMKAVSGNIKKIVLLTAGCVFLTWLFIASLLALGFGGSPFDNNPFDNADFNRSQWLADKSVSDGSNRRGHMAQDIVQHQLKPGMPQQQVIALLGVPLYSSSRAAFEEYPRGGPVYFSSLSGSEDKQADQVYRYYLGEELDMAWGIDHADLYLFFKNGRYVGSRIGWPG